MLRPLLLYLGLVLAQAKGFVHYELLLLTGPASFIVFKVDAPLKIAQETDAFQSACFFGPSVTLLARTAIKKLHCSLFDSMVFATFTYSDRNSCATAI